MVHDSETFQVVEDILYTGILDEMHYAGKFELYSAVGKFFFT